MLASYNKRNRSQAPSNRHENTELNTFQDPFKFQMNIFKEFDDFSNRIFGKMERNFGVDMGMGRMMERFSRMADFDSMGDFSDSQFFFSLIKILFTFLHVINMDCQFTTSLFCLFQTILQLVC